MTRNIEGKRLVWCPECMVYTPCRTDVNRCNKCGEESFDCRCIRCGHEWKPRGAITADYPRYCPKCKSKYFDRQPQRTNDKARKVEA